jgi:glycosyltransferase involved in cell wall biosynthesis
MLRLLTYTTLYPASMRPCHGIFVETRLRQLIASGEATSRVISPVPWFPFRHASFGEYAVYARVPLRDQRYGIDIVYPRYPLIPRVGMTIAPFALAATTLPVVRRTLADGYDFQAIDAHYFYPDGVAAAMIANRIRKPFVITARGTDINLIPRYRAARRMILWTAERAAAIVTVSSALRDLLVALGVSPGKIYVLRNGVDLNHFRPVDRLAIRNALGLDGTVVLSVGNLIESKGHHIVIEAVACMPDVSLLVAGHGPDSERLQAQVKRLRIGDRVRFLGPVSQDKLRECYCAADALVHASSREGWPNVLLESMACGTPVIATSVGGVPEIVRAECTGILITQRSKEAIVDAVHRLLSNYPDRDATRRYAEGFSWDATTQGQIELFQRVAGMLARQ